MLVCIGQRANFLPGGQGAKIFTSVSEQHLMQNSPQDVARTSHVIASKLELTPLPPRVWGFSCYLELCFSGQVEVMMAIGMSLMPYLATALFLKWKDQTTWSSFLICNTSLALQPAACPKTCLSFAEGNKLLISLLPITSLLGSLLHARITAGIKSALCPFSYICTITVGRAWKPPTSPWKLCMCSEQAK